MVRSAVPVDTSSTVNWIQAEVIVAPLGIVIPRNRMPTVCRTFSLTSSRSPDVVSNHPVADSSASSLEAVTATVSDPAVPPAAGVVVVEEEVVVGAGVVVGPGAVVVVAAVVVVTAPVCHSTWSRGAAVPSNDSAVLVPVPVINSTTALPDAQSDRSTIDAMSRAKSGVRWSVPATPTAGQAAGAQTTEPLLTTRVVIPRVPAKATGSAASSARMVRAAGPVDTSSTVNWIQAASTIAPAGMVTPRNRTPTVWTDLS